MRQTVSSAVGCGVFVGERLVGVMKATLFLIGMDAMEAGTQHIQYGTNMGFMAVLIASTVPSMLADSRRHPLSKII